MTPTTDFVAAEHVADKVSVEPIDHANWPSQPLGYVDEVYIRVTLHLPTGMLRMHANPRHRGVHVDNKHPQPYPGCWLHRWEFPPLVPETIVWQIRVHLTADQAETLLAQIAEQAQFILKNVHPVPGRAAGGYDWTCEAAATVNIIDTFCLDPARALNHEWEVNAEWTINHHRKMRGLADAFAVAAVSDEIEIKGLAAMTDAELDAHAWRLSRWVFFGDDTNGGVARAAHLDPDDPDSRSVSIYLVGVSRYVYERRRASTGGLTPINAARWAEVMGRDTSQITDSTPDAVLEELAAAEERAAADEGLLLLGARTYLAGVRANRRAQVREELAALGLYTQEMADRYEQARAQRAAMLLRVDAWGDPEDGEDGKNRDATLAAMAYMSRQGVAALRAKHQQATEAGA